MLFVYVIVCAALTYCDGARILLVAPTASYSHQIIYQPIWRELALRGHDMVVITPNPIRDPSIENLKEIDVSFAYGIWEENLKELTNNAHDDGLFSNIFAMMHSLYNVIEEELNHSEVQSLIRNETEYFDLVMVEYFVPPVFAFKQRFNCPFIGISSLDIGGRAHQLIGNPRHSVSYPEVIFGFPDELNFFERLTSVLAVLSIEVLWDIYMAPKDNVIIEKYFGPGYMDGNDLAKSVDMVFINTNPVFYQTRPVTPATIIISGGIHIKELKPLPKELQTFFDQSEGVIYFSLGSNVKSKDISQETQDTLMKVFSKLPYDILWKYEAEELPGKPDNVKIMKWAPQQDILRHPKVKLFITQGGIQSLEEALFSHVPVVVIPFFGDQDYNAKKVESKGLGMMIKDHKTMTVEDLQYKILEVISNPKYKNRAKELASLVKDEPMTALEKAVWWTEYVLRHGGAQHLKGKTLPIYQYYYLDVISFVLAITSIICWSLYFIFRKCVNFICGGKVKTA